MKNYLTSESVCQGHPDKLCDYIADSILDACLSSDAYSRVACEVMATKGRIIVAGEITSRTKVNIRQTVRTALVESGYNPGIHHQRVPPQPEFGHCRRRRYLGGQDAGTSRKSWEPGTVARCTAYATDETPTCIPCRLSFPTASAASRQVQEKRHIMGIRSDGKAGFAVEYDDGIPIRVAAVIVSVSMS